MLSKLAKNEEYENGLNFTQFVDAFTIDLTTRDDKDHIQEIFDYIKGDKEEVKLFLFLDLHLYLGK
jgi:hypothetical protein